MRTSTLLSAITIPKNFTDVVYLTSREIPPEVRRLFKQKKLSCAVLPVDGFFQMRDQLDLVGTVIIDSEDVALCEQQKLARIIQTLEMENIGVILLGNRAEVPIKSFALAPTESSFSFRGSRPSFFTEDLWIRISVNLAYRKESSGIAVKPAIPPRQTQKIYKNKLAEQLSMTGSLVDNLAEQLRLAGLVQQDFLPSKLPNTSNVRWASVFLPAEWVSGDIYDVARIDEDHIGFYVADVVGHGMPAALLTIFLKQALVMRKTTENHYRIFSPSEVMKNLNSRMTGQKLSGYQFATCCYGIVNTKTLEVTLARAGHPYPILIRAGKEPQPLDSQGSLLGIFGQAEYSEMTVQLSAGDKLLFYSDGAEVLLGSAENSSSGFSEDFLEMKNLPLVDMTDRLSMIAQSKEVDAAQVDDITIVGLEVLG